jgi:hypothetical protein
VERGARQQQVDEPVVAQRGAELEETGDGHGPHPHLDGALALALAASGRPAEAIDLGGRAAADPGATYLDRVVARVATALAAAAVGRSDEARAAVDQAVDVAEAAHDVLARALARTARASVLAAEHDPEADEAAMQAAAARANVEGGAAGWVTAVDLAARGGLAAAPSPA